MGQTLKVLYPRKPAVAADGLSAPEISLRCCLRTATDAVHQRLHAHSGFAAVKDGTISRNDYIYLLLRLHGFHCAIETATHTSPERSDWLGQDLTVLYGDCWPGAALPQPTMPRLDSTASVLGALYVIEGSALGGRTLARGLDRLLGIGQANGRRFFEGRGAATGAAWQRFLGQLETVSAAPVARAAAVSAAVETFSVFEAWLMDWRQVDAG